MQFPHFMGGEKDYLVMHLLGLREGSKIQVS